MLVPIGNCVYSRQLPAKRQPPSAPMVDVSIRGHPGALLCAIIFAEDGPVPTPPKTPKPPKDYKDRACFSIKEWCQDIHPMSPATAYKEMRAGNLKYYHVGTSTRIPATEKSDYPPRKMAAKAPA